MVSSVLATRFTYCRKLIEALKELDNYGLSHIDCNSKEKPQPIWRKACCYFEDECNKFIQKHQNHPGDVYEAYIHHLQQAKKQLDEANCQLNLDPQFLSAHPRQLYDEQGCEEAVGSGAQPTLPCQGHRPLEQHQDDSNTWHCSLSNKEGPLAIGHGWKWVATDITSLK